jgi:outer membrane protein TolC
VELKSKKLVLCIGMLIANILHVSAQSMVEPVIGSLDLTLDKAIEIALAENPVIKIAEKEVRLKQVAHTEAWQALLPTLGVSATLQHTILAATMNLGGNSFKMGQDNTNTATGTATLNLPLFAPTVYQNMSLTKEDIKLAQEKSRSSKLDLINQVTKAYYATILAQDSYRVMEKSFRTAKVNYDVVAEKYNVGKVSEYDKLSAEVQMRGMNSNLVTAQTGFSLATLKLKVLMGITENIDIIINDSLSNYRDMLILPDADTSENGLKNNSSLRQMDMNITLLQRTRKVLKTSFMPTLSMALSGQYQSLYNKDWNVFGYNYSPSASMVFTLNIPIYKASDWTKLKTNKIKIAQLQDQREDTRRKLLMSIETYMQNMASTIAQVNSNAEAVKQAEKAVMISSKRYEVGRGTILELNQSETAETQAQLTYVQSIYDYLTNKADLDYALGKEQYLK